MSKFASYSEFSRPSYIPALPPPFLHPFFFPFFPRRIAKSSYNFCTHSIAYRQKQIRSSNRITNINHQHQDPLQQLCPLFKKSHNLSKQQKHGIFISRILRRCIERNRSFINISPRHEQTSFPPPLQLPSQHPRAATITSPQKHSHTSNRLHTKPSCATSTHHCHRSSTPSSRCGTARSKCISTSSHVFRIPGSSHCRKNHRSC